MTMETNTDNSRILLADLAKQLGLGYNGLWRYWHAGLITAHRPYTGSGGIPATVDKWEADRIRYLVNIHKQTGVELKAILRLDADRWIAREESM